MEQNVIKRLENSLQRSNLHLLGVSVCRIKDVFKKFYSNLCCSMCP